MGGFATQGCGKTTGAEAGPEGDWGEGGHQTMPSPLPTAKYAGLTLRWKITTFLHPQCVYVGERFKAVAMLGEILPLESEVWHQRGKIPRSPSRCCLSPAPGIKMI